MKIVQIITGAPHIGGAQTHVRDLAAGLFAQGHDCIVLTGAPDSLFSQQLRSRGVKVVLLPALRRALNPVNDLRALVELTRTLRRIKPDLIAAHTAKAGFLGRIAGNLLGIPCVFTPHGWSVIDRTTGKVNQVFRLLERFAGLFGSAVIAVCRDEYETGRMTGIIAPGKLFCVHNGIPDCGVAASPAGDHPRILMIARFHKQKDHGTLLRALAALQQYEWRLQLVGAGPLLEQTRVLANSLGLEERVEFLGEREDTVDLLAQAGVFVLSTFFEAFPISILEAMRAGLPVVASHVGGVGEAVVHGVTGFLTPSSEPAAMAEALERLLRDPGLRRRMGSHGREVFLERFTEEHMISRTLEVYHSVLPGSPARAIGSPVWDPSGSQTLSERSVVDVS